MKSTKNFIMLFVGDGVSTIIYFFTTIYLARVLEVGSFGKLSFALAFYSFGSFLTNLGLLSIGTRDIAQNRNNELQSRHVATIISLRQFLGIISFLLLIIVTLIINKPGTVKLLIILYGLSFFPFALLLEWVFLGWEKMTYVAIEKILVSIFYFALIIILVKGVNKIIAIPIVFFISNLLGALFLFVIYYLQKGEFKININFSKWWQFLKAAVPVGLGTILTQFSLNFSIIFLGLIKSDFELGLFSAANKLLFFLLIFDRVFLNATFPLISRYYITGKIELSALLARLHKLVLLITIPTCFGGLILSRNLMNFIYSKTYESGYHVFQVLIWYFLITVLNSIYTSSLIAGQKTKEYVSAISTGVITNIILNIIIVPFGGAFGTAIALVVGEAVTLILLTQLIKPIARIKFSLLNVIKPIFATAIMVLFIWLLHTKISMIPLIIISALIYSGVILLIKGVTKNDFALSKVN